jgi:uncharacterized OB-fold protein
VSVALELPEPVPFPLPRLTPDNEFFFRSGADGTLRLLRCQSCGYFIHPPSPRCPRCGSGEVTPEAVSGRGWIYSYTIAVQAFLPGLGPYCVGLVQLEEQEDVRLIGPVVGCPAEEIAVNLPVSVAFFERITDLWIPYFRVVTR